MYVCTTATCRIVHHSFGFFLKIVEHTILVSCDFHGYGETSNRKYVREVKRRKNSAEKIISTADVSDLHS